MTGRPGRWRRAVRGLTAGRAGGESPMCTVAEGSEVALRSSGPGPGPGTGCALGMGRTGSVTGRSGHVAPQPWRVGPRASATMVHPVTVPAALLSPSRPPARGRSGPGPELFTACPISPGRPICSIAAPTASDVPTRNTTSPAETPRSGPGSRAAFSPRFTPTTSAPVALRSFSFDRRIRPPTPCPRAPKALYLHRVERAGCRQRRPRQRELAVARLGLLRPL